MNHDRSAAPATGRLIFTPVQNRVITTALTLVCALFVTVATVAVLLLALRAMGYFFHIVGPVIVAFYLSLLTRPWYARLLRFTGGRAALAATLFTVSVLTPLILIVVFFGTFAVQQGSSLLRELPGMITKTHLALTERFPELKGVLNEVYAGFRTFIGSDGAFDPGALTAVLRQGVTVGNAVFSVGSATLLWLLTVFYWVIFVMQPPLSGEALAARLPFFHANARQTIARYFHNFNDIIVSYFRGQIIDVTIQGALYGTAFFLMGLPYGFIIGFVLGLMNLVPYLGVTIGLCVALPVAFAHGGLGFTAAIFGIFCCIQTFDGYLMQPYIQGDRMKLSAWQIVFALLFWTQLGGFLGLLLAIPLTAFVKASWDEWLASSERFTDNSPAPAAPASPPPAAPSEAPSDASQGGER